MHIVIDGRIRRSSTGRYVDRLLDHAQNIDHDNEYTILVEPDDDWQPHANNFKALVCPYKSFSLNPVRQITFSLFLKKLNPDLVHFTLSGQQPLFYFGTQVTTTHDMTMYKFARAGRLPIALHWLRMQGYKLLMWGAHKKAQTVIVPCEFVGEDVVRRHKFARDKIVVTYEASEPPLQDNPKQPKGIEKPFILHVGTAFPHKNLKKLVDAFGLLHKKAPSLKLVIAGKKEYHFEKLAEHIAMKPYWESVILPGFVTDAELKWLYENAETFVLPSLSEGFGLPGLEAMTHGCPVISSNATCLPEVYGDAVHYFDPNDQEDMAEKIGQVLGSKKLRSDLIKKGVAQSQKYSWEKMAEETVAVYDQATLQ